MSRLLSCVFKPFCQVLYLSKHSMISKSVKSDRKMTVTGSFVKRKTRFFVLAPFFVAHMSFIFIFMIYFCSVAFMLDTARVNARTIALVQEVRGSVT